MAQVSGATSNGIGAQALDWQDFFSGVKIPMIGYDVKSDSIIVFKGADYSAETGRDILHFDIKTGAWTKGDTKIIGTEDISNPILNSDGELVVVHTGTGIFTAWDSSPKVSSDFELKSKSFDMGNAAMKKRLYKIIVEYKGTSASNIDVTVEYDQSGTNTAVGSLSNKTNYGILELSVTPVTFRDVSVKFEASGALSTVFELSSYSLVFRAFTPR